MDIIEDANLRQASLITWSFKYNKLWNLKTLKDLVKYCSTSLFQFLEERYEAPY